jgi:hypothetical protein
VDCISFGKATQKKTARRKKKKKKKKIDFHATSHRRNQRSGALLALAQVQPTKPKLMTAVTKNFSIEFPMAYGVGGLADGDDLVYYLWRPQRHRRDEASAPCFRRKTALRISRPVSLSTTMMTRRWGLGATRAFQKLWLVGGFTVPDWTRPGSATDLIESATRMSIKPEAEKLSAARGFILMLSLADRVYAIGGLSDCCQFGNIDVYRGQRWFQSSSMLATPRGDSCGGFLEGAGGFSAIVIGGRALDGAAVGVIEIIGPDDKLQTGRLMMDEARYGCVATTAPDRKSITVMGGIGKRANGADAGHAFVGRDRHRGHCR